MSQENVERFERVFETFNYFGRNPTATDGLAKLNTLLGFFDPDVVFEPQQAALQGTYRGHEGLTQWLADLVEHYGGGRIEFSDTRSVGGQVVAIGTLTAQGRGSGIEIDTPVAIVATFRDGLIVHFKDYANRRRALEAVGLTE
jgi:ketosteroid isomerase-like protein